MNWNCIETMKKKIYKLLSDKCKDMGLTDKALDELAELGSEGFDENASDEDIADKVAILVPFAKAMQGEITRKTSKKKTIIQKQSDNEGDDEGNKINDNQAPDWFKPFQDKLSALESENSKLKEEAKRATKQGEVSKLAKELGIPDYLMKRVSFADDADIKKELEDYKQELVNNNLVPKEQAHEVGATTEAMKADAKAWAASLPNK